ncbi:hypothetical protein CDL60_11130 [Roseateles noduli]|nr:hypothetical protein CDL60_11130 [Roseateles noduli]
MNTEFRRVGRVLTTAAVVAVSAFATGCATTPAEWPRQTVQSEQLRPLAPVRLQMNWMSGDGRPSGSVSLRGHLLADGSVGAVEILETSGRREFDQAAVMALRSARFNPHLVGGKPVEATVQARFSMPASKPAPFPR